MLSNCHFTGPTKLPEKRVTWVLFVPVNAFSHAPEPFTINDEPAPPAKVPPPRMLPLVRAPVEKLTEPRELPVLAAPELRSCPPADSIPALVIETVPNLLVRLI